MLEGADGPVSLNMKYEVSEADKKHQEEIQKKKIAEVHKVLSEFAIV